MDAARRQAYLATLGIDVWMARVALPGALPSLVEPEPEYAEPAPVDEDDMASYQDYLGAPPEAEVRQPRTNPIPPAAPPSTPVPTAAPVPTEAAESVEPTPRFALNFLHVPGAWLVMELEHADAQDFNNAEFGLLQNILKALRLPDQLGQRAVFHWPMRIGPRDHLRNFPQGATEASTAVMRTLNARLQREPEPVILAFGETAAQFLLLTQQFNEARGKLLNWPMQKAHLILTESLTAMLQDARRKKTVWRDLQSYFTIQS